MVYRNPQAGARIVGGDSPQKTPVSGEDTGVSAWGLERREVEKRIYIRKGAAHGFRNLSVIKISARFEQPITELKTKFDKTVNSVESGE